MEHCNLLQINSSQLLFLVGHPLRACLCLSYVMLNNIATKEFNVIIYDAGSQILCKLLHLYCFR